MLRYYPDICIKWLRKATKPLSQDSRSASRGLKLGASEYEAGILNTLPRR
jgi:hypothetical protein